MLRWRCKTAWTSKPSPACWVTTAPVSPSTPTPTSPPRHSGRPPTLWATFYPVLSGDIPVWVKVWVREIGSRLNTIKKYENPQKHTVSADFLARPKGFEPLTFWSVAALEAVKRWYPVLCGPFYSVISVGTKSLCPLFPPTHFLFWVKIWVKKLLPAHSPPA